MFRNKYLFTITSGSFFIYLLSICSYAFSNEGAVIPDKLDKHIKSALSEWKEIVFEGNTEYNDIGKCILAKSDAAASGLISETRLKVSRNTRLQWAWTAEQELKPKKVVNEKSKDGDDFLARVYVIHEGRFPWQTKAINYVWSRENAVGEHWPNPFLSNAHMLVVQSGKDGLGEWRYFERNVQQDFKKYLNVDIDKIDAIALMTDSDNTKGKAEACYQLPILITDRNVETQ